MNQNGTISAGDVPAPPNLRLRRALLVAGLVVAAATMPFFLWSTWHWTTTRNDSTNPESVGVYLIQRLAAGKPLHVDFRQAHGSHVISGHAPGSYLLPALVCYLAGGEEYAARLAGRLQSLGAFLLVALLVFYSLRRRGGERLAAAAAALLLLTSPLFYAWMATCRPDCLAVALALGGFLLVGERRTNRRLLLAGVLFLLAVFTKQVFLAAPAAIVLWTVTRPEERRRGLVFGGLLFAAVVIVFAGMHVASQGRSTLNLITPHAVTPWTWTTAGVWSRKILLSLGAAAPLLLPAVAATVAAVRARALRPVHLYFGLALLQALVTTFKEGSGRHYYFEVTTVAALLLGEGLTALARARRPLFLAAAAAWLLLLSSYLLKPAYWIAGRDPVCVPVINLYAGRIRFGDYPELRRRAQAAARTGKVLVTDPNTELRSGAAPISLDWGAYELMVRRDLIRPDDIRENMRQRRYAFIGCLEEYFVLLFGSRAELERYYLYVGEEVGPIRHFYFFVPRETPLPRGRGEIGTPPDSGPVDPSSRAPQARSSGRAA